MCCYFLPDFSSFMQTRLITKTDDRVDELFTQLQDVTGNGHPQSTQEMVFIFGFLVLLIKQNDI